MELSRELIEDLTSEGFDVREDYSGRGMFGRTCFGIVGDPGDLIRFVLRTQDVEEDTPWWKTDRSWITHVRTDSMGHDMIYYWPTVSVEKEDNDAT